LRILWCKENTKELAHVRYYRNNMYEIEDVSMTRLNMFKGRINTLSKIIRLRK
jgi:hypothetical protein